MTITTEKVETVAVLLSHDRYADNADIAKASVVDRLTNLGVSEQDAETLVTEAAKML